MHWLKRLSAVLVAAAIPSLAHGQGASVYQNGTMTPGHIAKFVTQGRIADAGNLLGDATGIGLNPFSATDSKGMGFCTNSAPTTGPYTAFCLGHDAASNALLSIDSHGMPATGFNIKLNGVSYGFPGPGNGSVNGPTPTGVGNVALWNNTAGTILKDGSGTLSGTAPTGMFDYAFIKIIDTATNTVPGGWGEPKNNGLRVFHQFSGGEANRNAIFSVLNPTGTVPVTGGNSFYTSNFAATKVDVSSPGNYFAYGGVTELFAGTGYIKGAEFDTSAQGSSNPGYNATLTLDLVNFHAHRGVGFDTAMAIGRDSSTTATYQAGIVFGDAITWWPFDPDSSLITTSAGLGGSPVRTARWGVDFLGVSAWTEGAFRSKGFSVGPDGTTTINPATTGANAALIVRGGTGIAAGNGGMIAMTNTGTASPVPTKWLRVDSAGTFQIVSSDYTTSLFQVGDGGAITMTKKVAGGNVPGSTAGQIELVCGSTGGKAKLIISAGTSATPVTIVDNIGAGVSGC